MIPEYRPLEKIMVPYNLNGIIEVPVPAGIDKNGRKIVGYLWPMHEGKRIPSDYVEMASGLDKGIFVLATHSWHMAERVEGGYVSKEAAESNKENVRQVISQILDNGFKAETIPEAVENFSHVN